MNKTTFYIKNMVCGRCIKVVKDEFEKLDIEIKEIELGKVVVNKVFTDQELAKIRSVLENNGFELIDDRKSQIIDQIKTMIIERIHLGVEMPENANCSDIITAEIPYNYSYLSKLFSSVEGITIEKYIIHQKIERAKELMVYNELSIKEIAFQLGYSSVQHLSSQFKKVSGLSPSHFKKLKHSARKPIDKV